MLRTVPQHEMLLSELRDLRTAAAVAESTCDFLADFLRSVRRREYTSAKNWLRIMYGDADREASILTGDPQGEPLQRCLHLIKQCAEPPARAAVHLLCHLHLPRDPSSTQAVFSLPGAFATWLYAYNVLAGFIRDPAVMDPAVAAAPRWTHRMLAESVNWEVVREVCDPLEAGEVDQLRAAALREIEAAGEYARSTAYRNVSGAGSDVPERPAGAGPADPSEALPHDPGNGRGREPSPEDHRRVEQIVKAGGRTLTQQAILTRLRMHSPKGRAMSKSKLVRILDVLREDGSYAGPTRKRRTS